MPRLPGRTASGSSPAAGGVSHTTTWLGVTDLSTLDEIGHWVQTRGEGLAAASIVVGLLSLMLSFAWVYNDHSSPTDFRGTQTFWMCAAVLAQAGNWKAALSGVGIIASCVLCLFFIDVRDRRRIHSPYWPRIYAVGTLAFGVMMSALFPVFVVAHALGGKSLTSSPKHEPAPSRSSIPASSSPEESSASLAFQIARRAPIVLEPRRDLNPEELEELFVPSDTKLTRDLKPAGDLNPEDVFVPSETRTHI